MCSISTVGTSDPSIHSIGTVYTIDPLMCSTGTDRTVYTSHPSDNFIGTVDASDPTLNPFSRPTVDTSDLPVYSIRTVDMLKANDGKESNSDTDCYYSNTWLP